MELVLFDEEHGYYSHNVRSIGAAGDFATAPSLCKILAKALADSIRSTGIKNLIEVGPGAGQLAKALRRELQPPFLRGFQRYYFHLVERSPHLREKLEKTQGRWVRLHPTMAEALKATRGEAFIFSNELVDAFPVRIFQKQEDWQELHLAAGPEGAEEHWEEAPELPESTLFDHSWPKGQRLEVHESLHQWFAGWTDSWRKGRMVTIDYGGEVADIYHRRPQGTIRGYYHHQRIYPPELYSLPGHRDFTADVNFDDLHQWGEQLGLHTVQYSTQAEYLQSLLEDHEPSLAEQFLTDPDGAGTAFKVLIQSK